MWDTPFKNGKKYADCFPNGGKNVAGNYPYFDDKAGKVVTFEMAINACRVQNGEDAFKYNDMKTIGVLTAYARTLSDGMAMNIKVDGSAATAAYEAGKKQFYSRRGQLNFSCATCHAVNYQAASAKEAGTGCIVCHAQHGEEKGLKASLRRLELVK